MERRINKKAEDYVCKFKENIATKIIDIKGKKGKNTEEEFRELLDYVYNYERFKLSKEDFLKRKRVKNVVPYFDRCCAKRANNEQCTRRKKEGEQFCGTHIKGTPHGIIDGNDSINVNMKVEVWAEDIKGIIYYIDKDNNVYDPEDIVSNKKNPKIIAKYTKVDDIYSIPALSL